MPVSELRGGLPLAIVYARAHGLSLIPIFFLIVLINILLIFILFFLFDYLHKWLMKFEFYRRFFDRFLRKFQKKIDKFEKRHEAIGFLALVLFVGTPLPGTGVWAGCFISWFLELDRKKSILSISLGVLMAGILVLLGSLGILTLFS